MIDLSKHKKYRHLLFGSLYFSEGLYQLMLVIIVPLYLIEKNVPIPIITLVMGIGELPWGVKFIWGGIIDFYHKYGRKKFTVYGTFVGAICFLILAIVDQYFSIISFTFFLFIGHVGICFLDTSADAWAIDITKKGERGKINASMQAGKMISNQLFAPILIIIGVTLGYYISFIIIGLIIMTTSIFPISIKYTNRKIKQVKIWSLMKNEFKKKSTKITTLYLFLSVLNPGIIVALIVLYGKTVLNLDDMTIGLIGAFLIIAIVPGAYIGGFLSDKLGRKPPLFIFFMIIFFTSLGFIFTTDVILSIILLAIIEFAWSALYPINWALLMDITNPKIGAAEFSVISSIINLGDIGTNAIAGTLVVLIGFQNVFLLSAILVIPAVSILYNLKIQK